MVKLKPENKPFIFNTAQVVFITTKFILNSSLNIHSHPACGCPWALSIAYSTGWNKICQIFNILWSYDKLLIDWVCLDWIGKYLALSHGAQTLLHSLLHDLMPNIFPSGLPTHSISTLSVRVGYHPSPFFPCIHVL